MDVLAQLEKNGVVSRELATTLQAQLAKPGTPLEATLVTAGVPLAEILKAKGQYYGVPTRELSEKPIPFDTLRYIPEESARYYHFAPLAVTDGVLEVGVTDPDNLEARDALTFISAKMGMPYKIFLISDTDFDKLLTQYKGLSGEAGTALSEPEVALCAACAQPTKTTPM